MFVKRFRPMTLLRKRRSQVSENGRICVRSKNWQRDRDARAQGRVQRAVNRLANLPCFSANFPLWRQKYTTTCRIILVRSMVRSQAAIALLLMLTSCQTPVPRIMPVPQTRFTAHGKTYCEIHRVPLVPRRMFTSRVMLIHYGDERCAEC